MPIMPYASEDDLLDELAEIAERRGRADSTEPIAPERRVELLATLGAWERELRAQLAEMQASA